jgi:glutamate racemase
VRIGVFDSGIGGVTVLKELVRRFPVAEFLYLGDTANVPYGSKSPAQVKALCAHAARELGGRGVDAVVVACNTASSLALPEMQAELGDVPVIGMVESGGRAVLERLQECPEGAPVLVLATRATVRSGAYGALLKKALVGTGHAVFEQACPLLVPMIEEGWNDHPILAQAVREYVSPFAAAPIPGVALLGCTHYPWIQPVIERALPGWRVVNSARAVGEVLSRAAGTAESSAAGAEARVTWLFTDPEAVPAFRWEDEESNA